MILEVCYIFVVVIDTLYGTIEIVMSMEGDLWIRIQFYLCY